MNIILLRKKRLRPLTIAYRDRVLADGGTVEAISCVDMAVKNF